MKICPKCGKNYQDEYSFCNVCGCELEKSNTFNMFNKKIAITAVILGILVIMVVGFAVSEQARIAKNKKDIEKYKYNKQLEEYRNTPTTSDLKINSGWTTKTSGNYIYINGTVTNTSTTKTISYYEIEAKFYDSNGKVVNSDWTNESRDLAPGESRKFEIMHRYSYDEETIRLSVKTVN